MLGDNASHSASKNPLMEGDSEHKRPLLSLRRGEIHSQADEMLLFIADRFRRSMATRRGQRAEILQAQILKLEHQNNAPRVF